MVTGSSLEEWNGDKTTQTPKPMNGTSLEPCSTALAWRSLPRSSTSHPRSIRMARWTGAQRNQECFVEGASEHYVVAIALTPGAARFAVSGRLVTDGRVGFGSTHLAGPGRESKCRWHEPFECVHLFVPVELMHDALGAITGREVAPTDDQPIRHDPVVARLAQAWLGLEREDLDSFGTYANWLGAAVLARLATTHSVELRDARTMVSALPAWRIRRATNYVEEHLEKSVTLTGMAEAARLSPMHFAAQFRRTVGISPHQYIIRRRIERAQELLRGSRMSLAEIALSSGFSSQTHFTTSFRQVTGSTPGRWRQLIG